MKTRRAQRGIIGCLLLGLGLPVAALADEPPDEGQILLEEIPAIADRSTFYSLPPDADSPLEALATLPEGGQDVIAMHLGRLHPNPYESTPGVAPLVDLLRARGGFGDPSTKLAAR